MDGRGNGDWDGKSPAERRGILASVAASGMHSARIRAHWRETRDRDVLSVTHSADGSVVVRSRGFAPLGDGAVLEERFSVEDLESMGIRRPDPAGIRHVAAPEGRGERAG